MTSIQIIFYTFATIAVFSGLMVVVSNNPVRGVLFLVLTFFAMAGIWLLLEAEFLALILVLVYVGAVMTLFLFVVMMLSVNLVNIREGFVRYLPLGALIVLLVVGLTVMVIGPDRFSLTHILAPALKSAEFNNLAVLGAVLYTEYVYPFEIAAVLLLTAMVAAISLAHRLPNTRKVQNIAKQISAQPSQRIRLVKMPTEKKP
jgi:NADH-quinone oxidoreductase subunit J